MGYHTDFEGAFVCNPQLTPDQVAYLTAFNETRRMDRDPIVAAQLPDPLRNAVGLVLGENAAFFVGGTGFMGQDDDKSVRRHNAPPGARTGQAFVLTQPLSNREGVQPSLWCQWRPSPDGTRIEWDGGEKFYQYVEWLVYLQRYILDRWGVKLSGEVNWFGEDREDIGAIRADNGTITVHSYSFTVNEAPAQTVLP